MSLNTERRTETIDPGSAYPVGKTCSDFRAPGLRAPHPIDGEHAALMVLPTMYRACQGRHDSLRLPYTAGTERRNAVCYQ